MYSASKQIIVGEKNKNVYILSICATLVSIGFFKEIQLSFLIVGHTHEDIDQRFCYKSSALKRQNIYSLKEMFQINCERPSFTKPFIHAKHLEYIRDWKSFITPYLREDKIVEISKPRHFRFYVRDNKPHIQYKYYARSLLWILENGHICLYEIPDFLNTYC